MIALDIDEPKKCLSCPCMWTLSKIQNIENKKYFSFRFCAAKHEVIYCYYYPVVASDYPNEWMDFKKPEWCPWINLEKKGMKQND